MNIQIIAEEYWGQGCGTKYTILWIMSTLLVSVVTTSFQFQLVGSGHLFMLVWLFLLNRRIFQHNLFKVLMLTTSLCLWAERERMSFVTEVDSEVQFHGAFCWGSRMNHVMSSQNIKFEMSTLLPTFGLFLEVYNGNKNTSSCLLSLTLFRREQHPQLMDICHN